MQPPKPQSKTKFSLNRPRKFPLITVNPQNTWNLTVKCQKAISLTVDRPSYSPMGNLFTGPQKSILDTKKLRTPMVDGWGLSPWWGIRFYASCQVNLKACNWDWGNRNSSNRLKKGCSELFLLSLKLRGFGSRLSDTTVIVSCVRAWYSKGTSGYFYWLWI